MKAPTDPEGSKAIGDNGDKAIRPKTTWIIKICAI
jgi:hypothetical protein